MKLNAQRVRDLLEQRDWTQGDLLAHARRVLPRLSPTTLSTALNGHTEPRAAVVEAIAKALRTNVAYLSDLSDNPAPEANHAQLHSGVALLARRINELPEQQRERVTGAVQGMLAVMVPEDEAGQIAQLTWLLDSLPDATRRKWQNWIRDRGADPRP